MSSADETDHPLLRRWRTSLRPKGSDSAWLPGEPLTYRVGPDAPTPLEYLNWSVTGGPRWSVAISEDGTQFQGTRDDPDGTVHEVRGELQTRAPARDHPAPWSEIGWTFAVQLTAQNAQVPAAAEWELLLDDGRGAPPTSISWLDRAGNSGSLEFSHPQPDTFSGWYRPSRGEVMNLRGVSTSAVADLVDDHASAGVREPGPVTTAEWREYLDASAQHQLNTASDKQLAQWRIQRGPGWLGQEPATEADITAAESRLGTRLPPSYRNFLLTSNGWSTLVGLYGALSLNDERFGWLRETQSWLVEAWADLEDPVLDALLARVLNVGYEDNGNCWLLDPAVIGPDGEWATYRWWCGDDGGLDRHHSFGALALSTAPTAAASEHQPR
jgi:hypothetical protein